MLRVISGKYRGRQLEQPPFSISRPTSDRTKEAVFSMIQFKLEGSLVLDLFSGSGALSIEAVSRGAMKSFAVEKNSDAIKVIKHNIKKLDINNIEVIKADVSTYLKRMGGTKFDFIFMDPPYLDIELYNTTLKTIAELRLLKPTGLVVLEASKPWEIETPKDFVIQKQKKYGKSNILLLANNI